jgi:hypothetical protein
MDLKLKQSEMMYSSLTGICAVFFLALLSSNVKLSESFYLFLSSLCFGVLFPIFTALLSVHLVCHDKNFSSKAILEASDEKWVERIEAFSQKLLVLAFIFLLCHFSFIIGISMFFMSIIAFFKARRFITRVQRLDHRHRLLEKADDDPYL